MNIRFPLHFALLLLLVTSARGQTVIHVDANSTAHLTGVEDGGDWSRAYRFLSDALLAADGVVGLTEVRIAGGSAYRPDQSIASPGGTNVRDARFEAPADCLIIGGYAGLAGGPNPDDRDPAQYPTTLTGDINQQGVDADNSYQVMRIREPGVRLAGLTIRDGQALEIADPRGGGLRIINGVTAEIDDCRFENNFANRLGGAVQIAGTGSGAVFRNCVFTGNLVDGNVAGERDGGAIATSANTSLTCEDCIFVGNRSGSGGGAIFVTRTELRLTGCVFTDNFTGSTVNPAPGRELGGAVQLIRSDAVITDCVFMGNSGQYGGAIGIDNIATDALPECAESGVAPCVTDCAFIDNVAVTQGGAIHVGVNGDVLLDSCHFTGNGSINADGGALCFEGAGITSSGTAWRCVFDGNRGERGGAVYASNAIVTLRHCMFRGNVSENIGGALVVRRGATVTATGSIMAGNSATGRGGAVHVGNFSASQLTLRDCTIAHNLLDDPDADEPRGGGLSITNSSGLSMWNTIVWGNEASGARTFETQLDVDLTSSVNVIEYSCVEGWSGQYSGVNVIGDDPRFFDATGADGIAGTLDDDLRLLNASPCIDAASNDDVAADAFDIDEDGDTSEPVMTDVAGRPRFADDFLTADTGDAGLLSLPVADMGALEYVPGCEDCPGARVWRLGVDGDFEDVMAWDPGLPQPEWPVRFDQSATYTVSLGADASIDSIVCEAGDVTLAMSSSLTLDLGAVMADAVNVSAMTPGAEASLSVTDGRMRGSSLLVSGAPGGSASFALSGADARWTGIDLATIGAAAPGRLTLSDGALLGVVETQIGNRFLPSASGVVEVGSGSPSDPTTLDAVTLLVSRGVLRTSPDSVVNAILTLVFPDGLLEIGSTLRSTVYSFGRLSIGGLGVIGDAMIEGDLLLVSLPIDPEDQNERGQVFIDVRGSSEADFIEVLRDPSIVGDLAIVQLSGGLFVQNVDPLGDPFDPGDAEIEIIRSEDVVTGSFDVAFFPALTDGRFLRWRVVENMRGAGGESVVLAAESLTSDIAYDETNLGVVSGAPFDVLVRDFTNDGLPDLAVLTRESPRGFVTVFENRGVSGGWLGFDFGGAVQIDVGSNPVAMTAGEFDGMPGLDLAVADAGDGVVRMLTNSGGSSGLSPTPVVIGSAIDAAGIAQAELTGDAFADIAVSAVSEPGNLGPDDPGGLPIVKVFPGGGARGFGSPGYFQFDSPVGVIDPADFDNDKEVDLAVASASDPVIYVLRNGIGPGLHFDRPFDTPIDGRARALQAVNLDGDPSGLPAFVVATERASGGSIDVILNQSTPGELAFADAVGLLLDAAPRAVVAVDMDGDASGDLDIAAVTSTDEVVILRNDSDDGDVIFSEIVVESIGDEPLVLIDAADVDLDGQADLVTISDESGRGGAGSGLVRALRDCGCPGDANCDETVDFADLNLLLDAWGATGDGLDADLTGDGAVNFDDLNVLLDRWASSCGG